MKLATIFLSFLLMLPLGLAQTENHATADDPQATELPCMFDFDRSEVPDCIHVGRDGSRSVASRSLKELPYKSNGLAGVWITGGWTYVNRQGKVVITDVPDSDNGPDEFHDGLVRFLKERKYGFANRNGKIVIPPRYDGAMPFQKGRARVCLGCEDKCVDRDCEHRMFVGGKWLSADRKGLVLK